MHRVRRWVPIVAMLAFVGCLFEFEAGLAHGSEAPRFAAAYREGPLDQRSSLPSLELPSNADELLGLGVLAAILYGFRVSGLARKSDRGSDPLEH